jgi:hypothetical protein
MVIDGISPLTTINHQVGMMFEDENFIFNGK